MRGDEQGDAAIPTTIESNKERIVGVGRNHLQQILRNHSIQATIKSELRFRETKFNSSNNKQRIVGVSQNNHLQQTIPRNQFNSSNNKERIVGVSQNHLQQTIPRNQFNSSNNKERIVGVQPEPSSGDDSEKPIQFKQQ
eukprot:scaffold380_cov92-Cylindrotheca_fusiformis.AAC.1